MTQKQEVINLTALESTPEVLALQAANWRKLKLQVAAGVGLVVVFALFVSILPRSLAQISVFITVAFGIGLQAILSNRKPKPNPYLQQFAVDNGLTYDYYPKYTSKGVIFYVTSRGKEVRNMLSGTMYGYDYALYWYTFVAGSGKSAEYYSYGVLEINLPKNVPNIFLDYRNNNGMLGKEVLGLFDRKNLVGLEGDFNNYFRVYAVEAYEVEVLQLLNPSFMQALVQHATYDIELVDNKAFIYLPNEVAPSKEAIMRMYSAAEFLIRALQKELDTFTFEPHHKLPDEMAVRR